MILTLLQECRQEYLKHRSGGGRQDGGRVGGHARPLPQTQQKETHLQDKRLAQNSNQPLAEEPKLQ